MSTLDLKYSRPLKKSEVPSAEELSPELLLSLYFSEGERDCSDNTWYFRPWLYENPKKSGVYVRRHWDGYIGFAYYDADDKVWLMASSNAAFAQDTANKYHVQRSPQLRELYTSNHQRVLWSNAPIEGLDLDFSNTSETALTLALLRWVADPQRQRRTAG